MAKVPWPNLCPSADRHIAKHDRTRHGVAGRERAAILYTLIETAKLNGLDLEAYLAHASTGSPVGTSPAGSANSCPGLQGRPRSQDVLTDAATVKRERWLTLTSTCAAGFNLGSR